jgi:general secretion pathway protein B
MHSDPPPAVAATPAPQSTSTERVTQSPAVRSLADEASIDSYPSGYPDEHPDLAVAATVPEGPPIVRPIEEPTDGSAIIRPGRSQAPPQPAEPAEVLPTLSDLAASGTNLPEMHLDIHVHSPVPAERFVFVNMRKYVEGQSLAEGPAVERITNEGVVLNHRGMRFLLPRQ